MPKKFQTDTEEAAIRREGDRANPIPVYEDWDDYLENAPSAGADFVAAVAEAQSSLTPQPRGQDALEPTFVRAGSGGARASRPRTGRCKPVHRLECIAPFQSRARCPRSGGTHYGATSPARGHNEPSVRALGRREAPYLLAMNAPGVWWPASFGKTASLRLCRLSRWPLWRIQREFQRSSW